MEQNPKIQENGEPVVIVKPEPFRFLTRRLLLILLILLSVFIISGLIGFFGTRILNPKRLPIQGYPLSKEQINLPISQQLLQHPALSLWSAHVKGKVIGKDDQSFTVAQIIEEFGPKGSYKIKEATNGATLSIIYDQGKTFLKQEPHDDEATKAAQVNFSNLTVGSIVNGSVKIQKTDEGWEVIGGNFFIK